MPVIIELGFESIFGGKTSGETLGLKVDDKNFCEEGCFDPDPGCDSCFDPDPNVRAKK